VANMEPGNGEARDFQFLFSTIKVGDREVKNRIVSTAHATGFDQGGVLSERHLRYHERKAAGGAGLVMTFGSASVYKESSAAYGSVSLWNPENEPFLRDLAERVHAHEALIMSQATHMGRRGDSALSGRPLQAPSAVPEGVHREIPHVLRTDEIKPIVAAFAEAAARLERCGWDGIEVTSFGGHLIEQFWSPTINKRMDRYGGNLTGRMRFSVEVIEAVADSVSDQFILGFRLTGDPLTDVIGLDRDDMLEIATRLDALGRINLFNVSGGTGATYASQAATVPGDTFARGCYNPLARRMKEHLSVPVLAAGRILDPRQAEEALAAGDCDLVAMTRAIIADPDMPRWSQKREFSRIRPCIALNEGCIGRLYSGMPIVCAVNPAIADDSLDGFAPARSKRRVVIVGGGPAGMEAARVAAERGHEATLLERAQRLGGQVASAAAAPERPHYGLHVAWLERELARLAVEVRLETEATADDVLAVNPGAVVLATGSSPAIPPEAAGVAVPYATDVDLLDGRVAVELGVRVLVYDREGKIRGGSIANFAAEAGASQVELATPLFTVCEDLDETQKPAMYRRLAKNGVVLSPNQLLIGTQNGRLLLRNVWSGRERIVDEADLLVFVGYQAAESGLFEQLAESTPDLEVHLVGDAVAPRRLSDAVLEGVRAGRTI
jgi:2,4-dienoyl-CoA reductase-like NADH-dependent reductase (Old Yellow Enzyme family)